MEVLRSKQALREWRGEQREGVALVPTMGFLHEGHLSLMAAAEARMEPGERLLVSIFVNPAQFDRESDLEAYPRDEAGDLEACRKAGVDAVFIPAAEDFYADDRSITVEETALSGRLCGASRPGHFAGVCLVLTKLFSLARPRLASFGHKDYQQLAIVRRLVRDLELGVEIVAVPTQREPDGLAMSSRNARLTGDQRRDAPELYRALRECRDYFKRAGESSGAALIARASARLQAVPGLRIDYLETVDPESLQAVEKVDRSTVIVAAVFFGGVRLIDNLVLGDD